MGVCRKPKDGTSGMRVHHSDIGLRGAGLGGADVRMWKWGYAGI